MCVLFYYELEGCCSKLCFVSSFVVLSYVSCFVFVVSSYFIAYCFVLLCLHCFALFLLFCQTLLCVALVCFASLSFALICFALSGFTFFALHSFACTIDPGLGDLCQDYDPWGSDIQQPFLMSEK